MKRFYSIILTLALILSSFTVAFADAVPLTGTPERSVYKNAGYDTCVTFNFNKEIESVALVRLQTWQVTDAETGAYGWKNGGDYAWFPVISGNKVTVDFKDSSSLQPNTEYRVALQNVKAVDKSSLGEVATLMNTGNIERIYVADDFTTKDGTGLYSSETEWSDTLEGMSARWDLTAMYGASGSQGLKNASGTAYGSVKSIKDLTGEIEVNSGNKYENLFDDLSIKVVADPKDGDNKVLMFDAGNSSPQNGTLTNSTGKNEVIFARLKKASKLSTGGVDIETDKKLVHSYKLYFPSESADNFFNDEDTIRNMATGAIAYNTGSNNGKATSDWSDWTGSRFKVKDKAPVLQIRDKSTGTSNIKSLKLLADEWNEITYVIDPTKEAGKCYISVIVNGVPYVSDTGTTSFISANDNLAKYFGYSFAVLPKYVEGSKTTAKLYFDDLNSASLGALKALDGSIIADSTSFEPSSDKVIINFTSKVKLSDVESALNFKDAAGNDVTGVKVALTDNDTTALLDLSRANIEKNTKYTITLDNTLQDAYLQTISNADTFKVEFETKNYKEYILSGPAEIKNFVSGSDRTVVLTADKEINVNEVKISVKDITGSSMGAVTYSLSEDNKELTLQLSGINLTGTAPYTLTVDGVKDASTGAFYNVVSIPVTEVSYLINDNFEGMTEGNWIGGREQYFKGNGYAATDWAIQLKNGVSGNVIDSSTFDIGSDSTKGFVEGIFKDATTGEYEAYLGIAKDPTNAQNSVFKYTVGKTNANGSYNLLVSRNISGISGVNIDLTKNIVAKYRVYLDESMLGTNLAVDKNKPYNDIPVVSNRSNPAQDNAVKNIMTINEEDNTLDLYYNDPTYEGYKVAGFETGKWYEVAYVVTPKDLLPDNTVKADTPVWDYTIYVDGVPVKDLKTVPGEYDKKYPGGFAGANNPGDIQYGLNFGFAPGTGATENGTMYIDDIKYLQPSKFVATTNISSNYVTDEPVVFELTSPVASKQYKKVNKEIVEATLSDMVYIKDKVSGADMGKAKVTATDSGYKLSVDMSELELTKGVEYELSIDEKLMDEWYQTVDAEVVTFTPAISSDVYLKEYSALEIASDSIKTTPVVLNPTDAAKSVWIAIAVYGEFNEMIGFESAGIESLDNSAPYTPEITVTRVNESIDFNTQAKKVKLFLWDSLDNMDPYAPAELLLDAE